MSPTANPETSRDYPREVRLADGSVTLRHMTRADRTAALAFARALPQHDLLFLRRASRASVCSISEVSAAKWLSFIPLLLLQARIVAGDALGEDTRRTLFYNW